jgi:lysine-specific demethylase 8
MPVSHHSPYLFSNTSLLIPLLSVEIHKVPFIEPNCFDVAPSSENECEIAIVESPSIEHFWTSYLHLHRPAKLIECINHWPALEKWKDVNYFIKTAGYRTVPIELGRTYDDDKWGQQLFRLGDFLSTFVSDKNKTSSTTGYLAQHDLFDQIPVLKNDFFTPDYCAISSSDPVVKSWIGPENTVSTMHTDDKHNFLCQVVGEKLIILATPEESENLYLYEGMLHNTSQVDAENLDFKEFPLAKNVKFLHVVLKAGEMLFIPKLWWHYCRSLSKSISVSFWFNIDHDE